MTFRSGGSGSNRSGRGRAGSVGIGVVAGMAAAFGVILGRKAATTVKIGKGPPAQASRSRPGIRDDAAEVSVGRDEHLSQWLSHVRRRDGPAGGSIAFLHPPPS